MSPRRRQGTDEGGRQDLERRRRRRRFDLAGGNASARPVRSDAKSAGGVMVIGRVRLAGQSVGRRKNLHQSEVENGRDQQDSAQQGAIFKSSSLHRDGVHPGAGPQ